MGGILGPAVNVLAIAYVAIILFSAFWPPSIPVEAANMNHCILMTDAALLFGVLWVFVGGRRDYKGC